MLQKFAGLEATGHLDGMTEEVMSRARCGVRDIAPPRVRRYALHGSRWKTRSLTYRVSKYPRRGLGRRAVDRIIRHSSDNTS